MIYIISFFPLATKILITTGFPTDSVGDKTDIIDFMDPNGVTCPRLQYPIKVSGATGGLIGTKAVICGGRFPYTNACHVLGQQQTITMQEQDIMLPALSTMVDCWSLEATMAIQG